MRVTKVGMASAPLHLADLRPGDVFERVCDRPKAVYLVCTHADDDGLRPTVDLTNNRTLPAGHFPRDTEVRLLSAELRVDYARREP